MGNCNKVFAEGFTNTSVDLVKSIFDKDELKGVHIIQGLFPQCLQKNTDLLDKVFAFASLDFDFEESIYEGLKYVFPRLEKGGYIMLHDYNSKLEGVKKAVLRFEKDFNEKLCKVPIPDEFGTLVITK